jgi:S1-C subfamily serine protease
VTGDVIRTLNGEPMTTLERFRETLAKLGPGSSVAYRFDSCAKLFDIGNHSDNGFH